ncbi:NAD-dependent epimerase/dehydratase family protein [Candidatus Saccharibacteria bacterium]|nr:NAD-dependent epimerase/dehydratase family protein [Candidatus Saccharibacteria bacterium]
MDVLLLGGTGAMGTHLVEQLSCDNNSVYVTTRSKRKDSSNVFFIIGNSHDSAFLKNVLQSRHWDAIVDFMCYKTDEFEKKYRLFLEATKQYVFLSSSRVYAPSNEKISEDFSRLLDVCDDREYLSSGEYALAKARQEDILKKSGKNNWTIIRPYVTFSEYRLQLSCEEKESWLYRALHGRSIIFSKDLADRKTTFTYGGDVAKGIASIIGKNRALGEVFHITNDEFYLWSDILKMYLDALENVLGKRPKVIEKEKYEPYMGGNIFQVKYDRLYDRIFDNTKIKGFVDTAQFKKTREAILYCIIEFVKKPSWLEINWGAEALKDRQSGEWISIKEWFGISGIKSKIKYLLVRLGIYTPKYLKLK